MFVGKRMTRKVVTASRGDTLKFASHLLKENRIHQLPVVEDGHLIGFLSGTDIRNSTFEETTVSERGEIAVKNKTVGEVMTREDILRIEEAGVRVEVFLPADATSLVQLIRAIAELNLAIRSLILSPSRTGYVAFIRISTIDVASVKKAVRHAGFAVPEVADFLE